jgi:murein hydrolase activator
MRLPPGASPGAPAWLRGALAATLLAGALGAASAATAAAPAQDEAKQRSNYETLREQARQKREEAQKLRKQEKGVLRQLRALEMNLARSRAAVALYQQRENRLARDIEVVERDLDHTRAARSMTQEQLARRLRAAYRFRRDSELEFLLSSRSFADLDTRLRWVGLIARGESHMVTRLGAQAESINVARVVLERKKAEIAQVRSQKLAETRRMEGLKGQRERSVRVIQTTRMGFEAAAADLERSAQRIKKLLDELERRRVEEERRRAQRGEKVPEGQFGHGRGSLPWPVRGTVVENFGENRHPKFGTVTRNNGVDIAAPEGTEIRAVEKGTVEFVDWYEGYGQTIILNHGGGFYTLYAHCGSVAVSQGQQVAAGAVIARVGDTGSLRGAELHFEVRKGKTAVDPLDWLR